MLSFISVPLCGVNLNEMFLTARFLLATHIFALFIEENGFCSVMRYSCVETKNTWHGAAGLVVLQ